MRVDEEIGYIGFLFLLLHMIRGVIEFLDESHWMIRLQRPEEDWKIQYACFFTNTHRLGKGDVELSFADIITQERLLKRDSRAPGLEEGQERLVEVNIDRPSESLCPEKYEL